MILSLKEAASLINNIDSRGYSHYRKLRNTVIRFDGINCVLTRVQPDPYTTPSILEVKIPERVHCFPSTFFSTRCEIAFSDFIARVAYRACKRFSCKCGSGYSGYIGFPRPGPWILKRSCVEFINGDLVLRLFIGLPARGRKILGDWAKFMLLKAVPAIIEEVLSVRDRLDDAWRHVRNYLDQEFLRRWLVENNYMFFIGDDSILPRESSLSQRPMRDAVPFESPESLRVKVKLPSGRVVSGMAVPMGFTVITGGGYHGKTTLLEAIQQGIYDHIEGDGRELVISRKGTILVKAEDGRIVHNVDISTFIRDLPRGENTESFSTLDASGSTSMAASINEAIEAGVEVILIDEDTSATNLLYKDKIMETLIERDPIKPLCSQVKSMLEKTGIGLAIIAGASSAYLNQADHVILMENFKPKEITKQAKQQTIQAIKQIEYKPPKPRKYHGIKGLVKLKAKEFKLIATYKDGTKQELDLKQNPRIVEQGQVRLIAHIINQIKKPKTPQTIPQLKTTIKQKLKTFKNITKPVPPNLTIADPIDVIWVLNRLYNVIFDTT